MTAAVPEFLGLSPTGLPLLHELVRERTGLHFDNGRSDVLAERIAPLVVERGLRSFLDLYYLLRYDDESSAAAWRDVLDRLSVQETYFWREIDQIRAVVDHIVAPVAAKFGVVRIWSAPCATGEEPLTIAMVLDQQHWFERAPIEIHASDGSQSAIAKARAGRYGARSFRALPPELKDRYFRPDGDAFRPAPDLSSRITSWSVVNLMSRAETAMYARCPIVFCRNAFIYFSPATVKRVVDSFADAMPDGGCLCVGASESLLNVTTRFSLEEIGGAFVYVKRARNE